MLDFPRGKVPSVSSYKIPQALIIWVWIFEQSQENKIQSIIISKSKKMKRLEFTYEAGSGKGLAQIQKMDLIKQNGKKKKPSRWSRKT